MKKIVIVGIVFLVIALITGFHMYKIMTFSAHILSHTEDVNKAIEQENWQEIDNKLKEIRDIWNKNRFWACLTLSTHQVDEIDISLEQSIEYSKIKAKDGFVGEFKMFCMLIEHLPKQECMSTEELL